MITSKIEPGEGRNTNTIFKRKKEPGLQKEEPGAGASVPDGAPDFERLEDTDLVRTPATVEALDRDCGRNKGGGLMIESWLHIAAWRRPWRGPW